MLNIFVVHSLEFGVQWYSGTEVLLPLWVYRDVHRVCSALPSVWISLFVLVGLDVWWGHLYKYSLSLFSRLCWTYLLQESSSLKVTLCDGVVDIQMFVWLVCLQARFLWFHWSAALLVLDMMLNWCLKFLVALSWDSFWTDWSTDLQSMRKTLVFDMAWFMRWDIAWVAACCSKFIDSWSVGADSDLVVPSGYWMYTPAPPLQTASCDDPCE